MIEIMNSICYNERQKGDQGIWVTRYDWIPTISENINDKFFSIGGIQSGDEDLDINNDIWKHDYNTSEVTHWFNKQHIFEFEFVVSDPMGVDKIFDDIQILSNNVQPKEMEITVIGDSYEFKRDVVELNESRSIRKEIVTDNPNDIRTTSNIHGNEDLKPNRYEQLNEPLTFKYDKRLKQSAIVKWQEFKDIYKFGRRIGNIQYKENKWCAQIEPLLINNRKQVRIRDKWAKIRIRYSGEDLAIITRIDTLVNPCFKQVTPM